MTATVQRVRTQHPLRRSQGLSSTPDGRVVPSAGRRLRPDRTLDDRAAGWAVTAGVTLLAGFLRLWHFGYPPGLLFDETYYAKDGWSLWLFGYGRSWVDDANDAIVAGRYGRSLIKPDPEMVVHPELGKWLIGAGEQVFGFDAFGWRIASAIIGTLMVAVMVRLVRRLTRSTLLGGVAGLLLCFDGLQFVLSRLALLDIFVAFFLLSAVSCLVADRDWGRARLAQLAARRTSASAVGMGAGASGATRLTAGWAGWGPVRGLRWRPWRLAAGVLFGLAISSKWTALVPLAGFGLLMVAWDAGARRSLGVRWAWLKAAAVDGLPGLLYLVGVALVVYVASWTGWLLHAHVYELRLSDNAYGAYWGDYTRQERHGLGGLLQGLRSLWHYHVDVWSFHRSGLDTATHPYGSNPRGWLVLNRPVGVFVEKGIQPGRHGCTAPADSTCLRQVLLLGTPVLWWGGFVALVYAVLGWLGRRDWRFGLAVVGVLTTWVPFFRYDTRPIFSFYVVAALPFTIVAICLVIGLLIGDDHTTRRRRLWGTGVAGAFVVLVVANFAWFWPIYTGGLVTTPQWLERIWFNLWI